MKKYNIFNKVWFMLFAGSFSFLQIACDNVKITDPSNPNSKPDLNTYISYDIEGDKVTYSDTLCYRAFNYRDYDFFCLMGVVVPMVNMSNPIPGMGPNGYGLSTKSYPYPKFGLTLNVANFSSVQVGKSITTDSFNRLNISKMYSHNTVSIYKKINPIVSLDIDTTAIIYEAGIMTIPSSYKIIGDWTPSFGNGKIEITKIEEFKASYKGLTGNYKFISGQIKGNLRKYRQGFLDKSNQKVKNYFMGNVPVDVKFRFVLI